MVITNHDYYHLLSIMIDFILCYHLLLTYYSSRWRFVAPQRHASQLEAIIPVGMVENKPSPLENTTRFSPISTIVASVTQPSTSLEPLLRIISRH